MRPKKSVTTWTKYAIWEYYETIDHEYLYTLLLKEYFENN